MLAFLKDRMRLPDGGYAPWTSPKGTPISLAAAWPRWMWSNGEAIFTRNGRGPWSRTPIGVEAQSYANGIFGVAFGGNVAPTGGDLCDRHHAWKQQLDAGIIDARDAGDARQRLPLPRRRGRDRAAGGPAPLLMQSGWTDALFPVGQALGAYDAHPRGRPDGARRAAARPTRATARPPTTRRTSPRSTRQGLAFFDAWLKGAGGRQAEARRVTAYTMTCPATAPSGGGPYTASRFDRLAARRCPLAPAGR